WTWMNESIERMNKLCPIEVSRNPRGVYTSVLSGLRSDNDIARFITPKIGECQNVLGKFRPLPILRSLISAGAAEVIMRQFEIERVRLRTRKQLGKSFRIHSPSPEFVS